MKDPLTRGLALGDQGADDSGRIFVRTAEMHILVNRVGETAKKAEEIVKEMDGYVQDSEVAEKSNATLLVRIPADRLEEFLDRLADLGKVEVRKISSEEVTHQDIDAEAELKNKLALRNRLQALLEKAETIDEILRIEEELARVQTDIDSLEARLKRLRRRVELARVTVYIQIKPILGPLGYLFKGIGWFVEKLFVIR